MPLRILQINVPQDAGDVPEGLLKDRQILGRWRDCETDALVIQLLSTAEESESIMDNFEQQFARREGFHVTVLPVEAVLPRPKELTEPPEESDAAAENGAQEAGRVSREELFSEVVDRVGVTRIFIGLTVLSAIVASVGLLRDDVAVIIGAMVIAPLLGPNMAMSLATTLGDMDLIKRALATNLVGVTLTLLLSIGIGAIFEFDPEIPAIVARTEVRVGDILLALAAGAAGTLAFTRGLSGAVIGVMVAVALMPPLVVAGLLLGAGELSLAGGALLLTGANIVCINLAAVGTFLIQGVRPRNWFEAEKARSATWKAAALWILLLVLLIVILWLNQYGEKEASESSNSTARIRWNAAGSHI